MSKPEYLKRTINKEKIDSTNLDEERSVRVYLPPGYNELITYPVMYAQDGQDIFMYGRMATLSNELILDYGVDPYIVVGIDVDKKKRTSEYSTNGIRNESYKRFIVEELIPFIEEKYPVKTERNHRLLIGDSLGGTVSLDLALDHPSLFSKVISLSGAYFEPTEYKLSTKKAFEELEIWMIVGTLETAVDTSMGTLNFVEWNRKIKRILEEKGASIKYLEKEGDHIWGFWQKHLPEAIRYFYQPLFYN